MSTWFIVVDSPFNQLNYPRYIGRVFKDPPSYAEVKLMPDAERTLSSIQIGEELLTIRETTFKGKQRMDVRKWYTKDGELLPGKGVSVPKEDWSKFVAAVVEADSKI